MNLFGKKDENKDGVDFNTPPHNLEPTARVKWYQEKIDLYQHQIESTTDERLIAHLQVELAHLTMLKESVERKFDL